MANNALAFYLIFALIKPRRPGVLLDGQLHRHAGRIGVGIWFFGDANRPVDLGRPGVDRRRAGAGQSRANAAGRLGRGGAAIEDVALERVPGGHHRMVEIFRRIMRHAQAFHHPS